MKVLLHVCCAPCAIFPHKSLKDEGHKVSVLFYNPNIYPKEELRIRREEVEKYCLSSGINASYFPDCLYEDFIQALSGRFFAPLRCRICWKMRLEESARQAKILGCESFTSTLLVSPYQDFEVLSELGQEAALKHGVVFLSRDFRPGFRQAHALAREKGMYCQKYCGCLFSLQERLDAKKKNKKQ